jgi:hypothetical protein
MRLALMAMLCMLLACSESFPPASAVSEFRVVGAKVEVLGDEQRANPDPGDEVQVSLLAIDRGALPSETPEVPALTPAPLQWALVPCVPLPVTLGPPICLDPIEGCDGCVGPPADEPLATPVARFPVPSEAALEALDASSVSLQGVVCSNGTPDPEAIRRFLEGESDDLVPCGEPAAVPDTPIQGRFVTVTIPIEDAPSDPNLNPELLNVLLDGASWPPPYDQAVPRAAARTGCASELEGLTQEQRDAHPRAGDQPSSVDLYVTQESLQTFALGGQDFVEELQVSWLGDGGGFERTFSFITDPARSVLTQWQPSQSVAEDGELVRFNFVIRDGRGGVDWVERGLCILPALPE